MKKKFRLPHIKCDKCDSDQDLFVSLSGIKLNKLYVKCSKCEEEINLTEKSSDILKEQKLKLNKLIKRLTKLILETKISFPKNKDDLAEVIKNPKHPFTASVITALVILLMEMSGFGIFVVLTWILGNLILNPVGWVLIPSVVAIAFKYRNSIKKDNIKKFGDNLKDLEEKLNKGEISKEDFEEKRDKYFTDFFE